MTEIASQQYKSNFLSNVIFRLDFSEQTPPLESIQKQFHEKIGDIFPTSEPVQAKEYELKIDNTKQEISTENKQHTLWRYKSSDNMNIVELLPSALVLNSKQYVDYTTFKKLLEKITSSFFEIKPEIEISRVGLRYINQIKLDESDFYNWAEYLSPDLISHLDFYPEKEKIRRTIQITELAQADDTTINFKYGIFNSFYPGKVSQKEFVLDYDCYCQIGIQQNELLKKIDSFNEIITKYFEQSITNKLRTKLNE